MLGARCRILVSSKLFSVFGLIESSVRWFKLCFLQKAARLAGSLARELMAAVKVCMAEKKGKKRKKRKRSAAQNFELTLHPAVYWLAAGEELAILGAYQQDGAYHP